MNGRKAAALARMAVFAAFAALPAVPAQSATHKIVWSPDFREVWYGGGGSVRECHNYPSLEALTECPKYRAASHTGLIDAAGDLVYIVQLKSLKFHMVKRTVNPVYEVLPRGRPVELIFAR